MREALDSMDLERVQELRRLFDQIERALQNQQAQQPAEQPAEQLEQPIGKVADINHLMNPMHQNPNVPNTEPGPTQESAPYLCSCGNLLEPGTQYCPKCGSNVSVLQQNPMSQPVAKVAQLPDEPQAAQPTDQGPTPMPTAPNPAQQADNVTPDNKQVQNPQELYKQEIANESAAQYFSRLENLDDSQNIVNTLAQKYGLPEDYIQHHLAVQAKFGEVIAINGDVTKVDIDRAEFEEVNPEPEETPLTDDFSNGIVPPPPAPENEENSAAKIEKGAKVPLQLIVNKIMQQEGVDEATATNMMKDNTWGDIEMPLSFNVPVHGELSYFLPKEAVGSQEVTESPFQTDQRPEDVMDQEYNQVPMQPAH